ncbi:MAG: hypothetical protein KH420_04635 [Clostridiales bacterium]|nr:hypothetical protein [Clostridiales bacterium]
MKTVENIFVLRRFLSVETQYLWNGIALLCGAETCAARGGGFAQASHFDVKMPLLVKSPAPNAVCGRKFLTQKRRKTRVKKL